MRCEQKELYPHKQVPALLAAAWAGHQAGRKAEAVGPDDFPVFAEDLLQPLHLLINGFLEETSRKDAWMVDACEHPSGRKLLAGEARWRGQAILAAAARLVWPWKTPRWDKEFKWWVYGDKPIDALHQLLVGLFQTQFELTEQETLELAKVLSGPQGEEIAANLPPLGVVMAVEKVFAGHPLAPRVRKELMRLLRQLITQTVPKERANDSSRFWRKLGANEAVVQMDNPNVAFKRLADLLLDDAALQELVDEVLKPIEEFGGFISSVGAVSVLLDLLEPYLAQHPMPEVLRTGLAAIQKGMEAGRVHKAEQRELGRLRALLGGPSTVEIEPGEAWSEQARADLKSLAPAQGQAWVRLLAHCTSAEASKPAKKWLAAANVLVNALSQEAFKQAVLRWFPLVALPRPVHRAAQHPQWQPEPDLLITDRNATILKGLAWCCSGFQDAEVSRALSALAEVCFKKVRWLGPRCPRVGNACLFSLSATATEAAAAQLSKLDQVVKQPTAKKRIGKSLDQAAAATGQSRADLEEKSVPTYDLSLDGKLSRRLGEHTAELRVVGSREVQIAWFSPEGKPLKAAPAALKREHAAELKQLQKLVKDLQQMLGAQRIRLERLLMSEREWDFATWRERYLEHPLLAPLARRLIWQFKCGEQSALGAWREGKLVDVNTQPLEWLAADTHVRLWHPIGFPVNTIAAWRRWLEDHQICQPFKQAHREVYLVTNAELETATYSNRFAAHIIGQHQFAALAVQRGWKYSFMGGFDVQSTPTLELPTWNLAAEFWVEPSGELTDTGVARYLATDQVRFVREGRPLVLREVPALVLTEVMRDVDLFVGVCSIGNDPTWQDRGEAGANDTYWREVSFGKLSVTAETRREVLERLLPRLKIASQCQLGEKFLKVHGSLRTYKIHLGSGNILMEPNDSYLCIVPDPDRASERSRHDVFLPFEGDNTLAVILSKAFLLAEDAKIKDKTILRQITPR